MLKQVNRHASNRTPLHRWHFLVPIWHFLVDKTMISLRIQLVLVGKPLSYLLEITVASPLLMFASFAEKPKRTHYCELVDS